MGDLIHAGKTFAEVVEKAHQRREKRIAELEYKLKFGNAWEMREAKEEYLRITGGEFDD